MGFSIWEPGGDCHCGCTGAGTTICVKGCSGTVAVYGATVQLWSGATPVDSGVTDATGCCTFADAGTFDVKVVYQGTTTDFGNKTLAGTPINLALSTGYVCCGSPAALVPWNITLTDSQGAIPFCWDPAHNVWWGGRIITASSVMATATGPGGSCAISAPSAGPVAVWYSMQCAGGGRLLISREWPISDDGTGTNTQTYYQNAPTITCGVEATHAPPPVCFGAIEQDGCFLTITSTVPFAASCTPGGVGTFTTDPLGATSIAVSA